MPAAIIGQNYTLSATFTNADGTPLEVTNPITYEVYSFDNRFILEGTGIQDRLQPQNWYANIVIPEGAPIPQDPNNEQYRIDWYAEKHSPYEATDTQMKSTQEFQVLSLAEPVAYDSAIAVIKGQPIKDNLITSMPVLKYTLTIIDENDHEYFSTTNEDPGSYRYNDYYITKYDSVDPIVSITDKGIGSAPYLLIYDYETETGANTEVHMLYMVNGKAMILVNSMRRYLDKARNYDIDPSLRWTDVELIHFITSGINRFNASLPTITNFNLANFPNSFIYVLEKLAEHEALNSLYLAEGMRAFDFTGSSVTLNIDRTEYIKTKMDEIGAWLDNNLVKAKGLLTRQTSGTGLTSISLTSVTNGYSRFLNNYMLNRLLARRY